MRHCLYRGDCPSGFSADYITAPGGWPIFERSNTERNGRFAPGHAAAPPRPSNSALISIFPSQKQKRPHEGAFLFLAGGEGFEPPLAESESAVLPLDDPPKRIARCGSSASSTASRDVPCADRLSCARLRERHESRNLPGATRDEETRHIASAHGSDRGGSRRPGRSCRHR